MNKIIFYGIFLSICTAFISGCVLLDRPSPPKLTGIPFVDKDFATVTVVRKKQYSTSGTVFTLTIDEQPFVELKQGQYTSFRISPEKHVLNVIWDIAGFTLIGPYGGFGDSPQRFNKKIDIQCGVGDECFITMEGKVFVKKPEDRVIINQVDQLEGDFCISDKSFVEPLISK